MYLYTSKNKVFNSPLAPWLATTNFNCLFLCQVSTSQLGNLPIAMMMINPILFASQVRLGRIPTAIKLSTWGTYHLYSSFTHVPQIITIKLSEYEFRLSLRSHAHTVNGGFMNDWGQSLGYKWNGRWTLQAEQAQWTQRTRIHCYEVMRTKMNYECDCFYRLRRILLCAHDRATKRSSSRSSSWDTNPR